MSNWYNFECMLHQLFFLLFLNYLISEYCGKTVVHENSVGKNKAEQIALGWV